MKKNVAGKPLARRWLIASTGAAFTGAVTVSVTETPNSGDGFRRAGAYARR